MLANYISNMAPALIEEISSSQPLETATLKSSTVDKAHLAKVVEWKTNIATSVDFSWGKQMSPDDIVLSTLHFEKLGDVAVPVSTQDMQRLREISHLSTFGKGLHQHCNPKVRHSREINPQFMSIPSDNFGLSSLIINNMNLPFEAMNVDVKLDKIILYETDGHYQQNFVTSDSNVFGTAILQIPVEGGHEGGRLKIGCKDIEKLYETHQCSHQKFYTTVFFNGCENSMESVTRGSKLTLVFNLVWVNAKTLPSQDFAFFLSALKEMESTLAPWIRLENHSIESHHESLSEEKKEVVSSTSFTPVVNLPEADSDQEDQEQVNVFKQLALVANFSKVANLETSSDDSSSSSDMEHELGEDDLRHYFDFLNSGSVQRFMLQRDSIQVSYEEKVLFFVLQEKYDHKHLAFHRLRGKDRDLASLLQNCKFLDVHLAEVTHKLTITTNSEEEDSFGWGSCFFSNYFDDNESTKEESVIKTSRWIDSNDTTRIFTMDFNWLMQCVGIPGKLLSTNHHPDKIKSVDDRNDETTIEMKSFYHNILVIWPKFLSTRLYCQYGLHSLLDRIETSLSMLKRGAKTREEIQLETIQDVKEIIAFWYEDPQRKWEIKNMTREDLTLKLMRFCIDLRARDEGLRLLKTLVTHGLIPNEDLIRAIVEFECQVTGWEDCAEIIKQMISSERISHQLIPIPVVMLGKGFLDVTCLEGVNMIGTHFMSTFAKANKQQASSLSKDAVDIYADFIISMETNPETSSTQRLTSFVSFFTKLDFSVQCQLVLGLETNNYSRLKGNQSCQLMFHQMCQALAISNLHVSSIKTDAVVDLMGLYIRVGNTEHLHLFTSNICRVPPNTKANEQKNTLVENLISSSVIWGLAIISELAQTVMTTLVDYQLVSLAYRLSAMPKPCQKPLDRHHRIDNCELHIQEERLKSSVSFCIKLVMKMERNIQMADSKRVASTSTVLGKLSAAQLCHLLVDIHKTSSERLRNHPSSFVIIRQICELILIQTQKVAREMPDRQLTLEVLKCFIELCDESSRRLFIDSTCKNEVTGSWSQTHKYQLFHSLITSADIWSQLEPSLKLNILNSCNTLVETWITQIVQLLSSDNGTATHGQGQPPIDALRLKISKCVQLFILTEKSRFDPLQMTAVISFQPFFAKLPPSRLLDLVVDLYVAESKVVPNLKKFAFCLNWYRDVCRLFFSQDFVPLFASKRDVIVNIIHVLAWLDDEQCWNSFALQICKGIPLGQSRLFVRVILATTDIHLKIQDSPFAFSAFNRIVSHAVDQAKFLKDPPPFTWKQPNAVVNGHPDIESFLRSDQECVSLYKFKGIAEARRYAVQLEKMNLPSSYNVTITTSGVGKFSRCTILKSKNDDQNHQITKSELEELVKLRQTLQMNVAAINQQAAPIANAGTSDDVYILLPSAKRIKLDVPVVELN